MPQKCNDINTKSAYKSSILISNLEGQFSWTLELYTKTHTALDVYQVLLLWAGLCWSISDINDISKRMQT